MKPLSGSMSGTFEGRGTSDAPIGAVAVAIAFAIHAAIALVVGRLDGRALRPADTEPPVEIDVNEPPPPPAALPDLSPPAAVRRAATPAPTRETARRQSVVEAPPPPNQEPPPEAAKNVPPVFGVTMSSVVSGEAAMAVQVGNTTMTKSRARTSGATPQPYSADGTGPFVPAPEMSAATLPHVLQEVNSDDVYPPEARNLGLEGAVELAVDIDERGKVVHARVVRPAGHKFDEAAVDAMKRTVFSPARARDGHPIPYRLTYRFVFTIKN